MLRTDFCSHANNNKHSNNKYHAEHFFFKYLLILSMFTWQIQILKSRYRLVSSFQFVFPGEFFLLKRVKNKTASCLFNEFDNLKKTIDSL